MSVRPTSDELLEAVGGFIDGVKGDLEDRDVFLARVALNAIALVRRELQKGPLADAEAKARLTALLDEEGDLAYLNARLCARIKAGAFDAEPARLESHLIKTALDQIAIDQPGYSGLRAARARLKARDGPARE